MGRVGVAELLARLERRPLLLDGGLGSMFIAAGLEAGRAPEWWIVEHPERVTAVHRRYVEAGSEVIHSNTFGGSPPKLASVGLDGRCAEINAAAIRLARQATEGSETLVAGDVGPTGKLFAPMGAATEQQLQQAFSEQVEAMAGAGADLISIETMYDLREARVAVTAACATGLPVLASMTFDIKKRGCFTLVGDRLVPSLAALQQAGAHAVGFNCSVMPGQMLMMVDQAREAVSCPLVAQPNAGQPRPTASGEIVYDAEPESFARKLVQMVQRGVRLVGGCCGSTPEFIAAARRALDAAE